MPKIYLRHLNGINPELLVKEGSGPFRLKIGVSQGRSTVWDVEISDTGNSIESFAVIEGEDDLARELVSGKDINVSEKKILWNLFLSLGSANSLVLKMLEQELCTSELHTLTSGYSKWSLDKSSWNDLSYTATLTGISVEPRYDLDNQWVSHLQALFDGFDKPLDATEFIYEAKRAKGLRFKWIQATIAAELAIKEALIRLEPKIKIVLLELPSPPLHKLYGTVLEEIAGEISPYLKAIKNGVEIRNKLVHRPEGVSLDEQEVVDYVNLVEKAIRHLISLCRGKSGTVNSS